MSGVSSVVSGTQPEQRKLSGPKTTMAGHQQLAIWSNTSGASKLPARPETG
jgi:hypothetical protein